MKIFASNIKWDTDGDVTVFKQLPQEIEIPENVYKEDDDDAISDYISNETGFCHGGFELNFEKDTKLYLVSFLCISDCSAHSCNIPDAIIGQCIIETTGVLSDLTHAQMKQLQLEQIGGLYDQFNADGMSWVEISADDYIFERYVDLKYQFFISESDIAAVVKEN